MLCQTASPAKTALTHRHKHKDLEESLTSATCPFSKAAGLGYPLGPITFPDKGLTRFIVAGRSPFLWKGPQILSESLVLTWQPSRACGTHVPQLDKTAEAIVFSPSACLAAAGTVEASQEGGNSQPSSCSASLCLATNTQGVFSAAGA